MGLFKSNGYTCNYLFRRQQLNSDLSKLITLQDIDVEIKQIREEIDKLPQRQQDLESRFAASVKEYLDLKQQFEDAQSEKIRIETDLENEQARHQKFKTDLMKATNEREYTTAVREIDVTRKNISLMETEILKLMEKIEKCESLVGEKTPEMEARRVEVDKQLAEWAESSKSNQTRLEELSSKRLPLLAELSPGARSDFERLSKMRTGLALAEARNYSCMGCRMTIRPQVFNDIRRGEAIITCESCGRILFFRAEASVS